MSNEQNENEQHEINQESSLEDTQTENSTPEETTTAPDLAAEVAEWQDRYIRLAAEMENLRRRTQKEVQDARSYSVSSFARDVLSVVDNLQRTLKALPPEEEMKENTIFKSFVQGVEMTEREMLSTLEKHGVKSIDPKGEKFDPHFHQAIFESPNESFPDNHVQEVIQIGFIIGDRILRPALVGVVKNPKQ